MKTGEGLEWWARKDKRHFRLGTGISRCRGLGLEEVLGLSEDSAAQAADAKD